MDNQEYTPEQSQKSLERLEFETALSKCSDGKLKTAQIIAFIPIIGWFGVQDFIIGRKNLGLMRLFFIPIFLVSYIWVFLLIWSIVEGLQISRFRKNKKIWNLPSAETFQSLYTNYYNRTYYAIISFILTIIPILFWIYCLVVLANTTDYSIYWYIIFYYCFGGMIVYVISVIFGFKGLKTKLRWLSIVSLTIKIIAIIGIAIAMPLIETISHSH